MTAKKKPTKPAPKRRKAAAKRKRAQPKTKKAKATPPKPGTTITRAFKGAKITVKVTADGFLYRGKTYRSLTQLALEITGYKAVSGPRFFGLVKPKTKGGAK